MSEPTVATIEPMPVGDDELESPNATDVLAPILIRDVPDFGPHLYTGRLEPRGQVAFGSTAVGIEVRFKEVDPLEDLQSPFRVAAGPAITATVAKGMSGTFPFEIKAVDGTFAFPDLVLEVAERPNLADVFRVGFLIDATHNGVLQVYVKPGKRRVDAHFSNETGAFQTLELDPAGAGASEPLTLQPHQAASRIFTPPGLGSILRVTLEEQRKPDDDRGSGGVQQADIIVEPPP